MSSATSVDFDIVVAGCGVAGTAAAASAVETARALGKALRVLILERTGPEKRGGNSRWTAAYLRMEDEHSPAPSFVDDMLAFSGGRADEPYLRALAQGAGETLAWVRDKGVAFDYLPTIFLTQARPRLLPVGGGRAVLDALANFAEANGAQIAYKTTAWRLMLGEDGAVAGIWVRGDDGKAVSIRTHAVILAAGGFEGNPEMMTQYIGKGAAHLRTVAEGGQFNKGEGIRMALEIGARAAGEWDLFHAEPIDPRSQREEAVVMTYPYAILVDGEGRRFVDEGVSTVDEQYEAMARRIFNLPGHRAWVISDQKMYDIPGYEHAVQTNIPPVSSHSIAALAEQIGLPAANLQSTVAAYNAAIQPGHFDPLRKDGKQAVGISPPKSNWAIPIDKPPYIAFPLECSVVFTFGGLATDTSARVLSTDDYPIPGLYAAGEITGLYFGKYPGATSVLRGLVFGRIAGREAAQYAGARA